MDEPQSTRTTYQFQKIKIIFYNLNPQLPTQLVSVLHVVHKVFIALILNLHHFLLVTFT
jgi:hypothetical protein